MLSVIAPLCAANLASAAPSVSVTPPNNARFLAGQRFDLRVEGKGTGPYSATLSIDGVPQTFTSGAQNTTTTDGLTSAGYGGFNMRGYSNGIPGVHTLQATLTDSTGTSTASGLFEVMDLNGDRASARNVIIMLGDGMGAAHRTAARLVRYGVTGGDPNGYLAMDHFPATGMLTTHSLNSIVTDSAPGMACYSTGVHAQNSQEGVFPAHMVNAFFYPRVEYMSEYLHRTHGKALGLVTTADVEDATPAANAVHTGNRNAGTGIVDQYFDESDAANSGSSGNGLHVLLGGGRRWFLPSTQFGSSRSIASDYPALPADLVSGWHLPASAVGAADPSRDLIADFRNAGFQYVDSATSLASLVAKEKAPEKLLGLFGYGNMNVALDKLAKRRNVLLPGTSTFAVDDYHAPDQPMLDEMTSAALKVLKRHHEGFVLLVEGAHIDKQSHAMDAERAVDDTLEFDRAVAVVRNFAENVDRRTVVVVLADHECSGFSIIGALNGTVANLQALPPDGAVTDPSVVPARQAAVGTYDLAGFPQYNILADGYPASFDIDGKILFGFGASGDRYETWLTRPRPIVDSLLSTSIASELATAGYPAQPVNRSQADGFFLRGQAVGQTQAVHTASDVPVSAYAARPAMAMQFVGVQRNTDVFVKLMRAVLGGY
ncbi:MAG TPA: alkaline phosphatase [Polyangiales bacterium]